MFSRNVESIQINTVEKPSGLIYSVHKGGLILWLGGENGLFAVVGNKTFKFEGSNLPFYGADIEDIYEDTQGFLWVATFGKGVFYSKLDDFERMNFLKSPTFDSQYCVEFNTTSNVLLVNCSDKIIELNRRENYELFNTKGSLDTENSQITKFSVTTDSVYASLDAKTIIKYDITSKAIDIIHKTHTEDKINTIFVDSRSQLWLGLKSGLAVIPKGSNEVVSIEKSKEGFGVSYIFTSKDEQLVFYDGAFKTLTCCDLDKPVVINILESIEVERVYDVEALNDDLYLFSAPVKGVTTSSKLNRAIGGFQSPSSELISNIEFSYPIDKETIAIATNNIIYLYSLENKRLTKLVESSAYIDQVFFLNTNEFLYSSEREGLVHVTTGSKPFIKTKLFFPDRGYISHISKASSEEIYFSVVGGSKKGLYKLDANFNVENIRSDINPDGFIFTKENKPFLASRFYGILSFDDFGKNGIENNYITNCLVEASDGTLWVCTDGAGLGYFDPKSKETRYIDPKYTANSRFIRELVQDTDGYFWVMTNQGLVRYDHINKTSFLLGEEEGIADVDFEITASINLTNDRILVAGDTKNYIIDTQSANESINKRLAQQSDVVLTSVSTKQDQKSDELTHNSPVTMQEMLLPSDNLTLSLNFAVNNFLDRNIIAFEYRMLGLNKVWTSVSPTNSQVTYTTLPSGSYQFQVRALDPKSTATQPITTLALTVLPPFWQTWQAYALYSVVAFLTLLFGYKYRIYRLRVSNDTLELAVHERTVSLAQSQNKIGDLLQHKESLFANTSHELRTPLTLITSPIEKLEEEIQDAKQQKYIQIIKRNTKRLCLLVDHILELSQIDSKSYNNKQPYQYDVCLQLLVDLFRPISRGKHQSLTLKIDDAGAGYLTTDSLEKVVSNLVINAIKYTPINGSIDVHASANESFYKICVTDNGPGIPEEELSHIYGRFTRLSTSENTQGTGLGLALVKEVLQNNGGDIKVTSVVGQGSSFTVLLPLSDINSAPKNVSTFTHTITDYVIAEVSDNGENCVTEDNDLTEEKNLLIVEDDSEMRGLLYDLLKPHFNCVVAENGEQGFTAILEYIPDLVITDLMMPKMSGFELADKIRMNELTSHIPILILTAKGDQQSRLEGWTRYVDDYISKPFHGPELILRINSLIAIRALLRGDYSNLITEEPLNKLTRLVGSSFTNARDKKFFKRFVKMIETSYTDGKLCRTEAASRMAISERQLNRKLNGLVNLSFNEYLRKYRLAKAKLALQQGQQISVVAYDVGFSTPSYFSNCFKTEFKVSPRKYVESLQS